MQLNVVAEPVMNLSLSRLAGLFIIFMDIWILSDKRETRT